MNTITKLISIAIVTTLLMSCGFTGITGSKKVIKEKRNLTENIEKVKVSTGIDLFLIQGNTNSLEVEADDNIINLLITEVIDGELRIYFDKIVRNVKARKVYLTISSLKSLKTSSGADVKCKDGFSGESIIMSASSGSGIDITLNYKSIDCSCSSGSDVNIVGKSDDVSLDASSGSDIEAKKLLSKIVDAEASSGSNITIFVSEKITANASSGGNIIYLGDPSEKEISKSSGGSISAE